MSIESQLREKLRKIDALFAGAGTARERLAAEAALERVRERLTELARQDSSIEMRFLMPDQWSRHLFLALWRRYGMKPYRYYRQRQVPFCRLLESRIWTYLPDTRFILRLEFEEILRMQTFDRWRAASKPRLPISGNDLRLQPRLGASASWLEFSVCPARHNSDCRRPSRSRCRAAPSR
jgi:hypothetical protein